MRTPPEKPTYTFSNGVTVTLERVGPLFALPIQKANPPPDPPMAPGVGGLMEPNDADPDYHKALEAYHTRLGTLIQMAMFDAGISDDLEIDTKAVARLRRIAKEHGGEIVESDRMAYITYCLLSDTNDIAGFNAALATYGHVAEEDIRAAGAMFPGDGGRESAGEGA